KNKRTMPVSCIVVATSNLVYCAIIVLFLVIKFELELDDSLFSLIHLVSYQLSCYSARCIAAH
ncbi:MAG: hypothetical protein V3U84_10310, partial [Thiotrichaceae bacterium]